MATAAQAPYLSVEQYLHTSYRPDVDYVDGQIEERPLGEYDHSTLQFTIARLFHARRHEWQIRVAVEQRVQTSAFRFRVPDVVVLDRTRPKEQVVRTPPLLCIEVLSPEDTVRRMMDRVQEYLLMGVRAVWLFDPRSRAVTVCSSGGVTAEQSSGPIELRGTPITLDLQEIFSALDED